MAGKGTRFYIKTAIRWAKTRLGKKNPSATKAHLKATKIRCLSKIATDRNTKKYSISVNRKKYPWVRRYVNGEFPRWLLWDEQYPDYMIINADYLYPLWRQYLGLTDDPHVYDAFVYNCSRYLKEMYSGEKDPAPPKLMFADTQNQTLYVPKVRPGAKYNGDIYFNHRGAGKFMRNIDGR